jgi:hypothetical protein
MQSTPSRAVSGDGSLAGRALPLLQRKPAAHHSSEEPTRPSPRVGCRSASSESKHLITAVNRVVCHPDRGSTRPGRFECPKTSRAVGHPVGRRRTGSDHHREVGWRGAPHHKGRAGSTCSIVPSACRRRSGPRRTPSRVRVCPECSCRSDQRRQSRTRRARRHLFDPRLVAKLRSPHGPVQDHRPPSPATSASAVPYRPASLMRTPAVGSSLAPLPPRGGQHHEAANLAAGLTPGSWRSLSSRRSR